MRVDGLLADAPGEEAGLAEERGDEPRLGVFEDGLGVADLLEAAVVEHSDAVRNRERLLLVVGDRDSGDARLLEDTPDLLAHLDTESHVEVRERFVEQEDVGFGREAPGERHTLLLPAGELVGRAFAHSGHVDEFEEGVDALRGGLVVEVGQPERDVLPTERWGTARSPGRRCRRRGSRRPRTSGAGDGVTGQRDGALGRAFEASEQTQRRGLPAAGGTEQREEFAVAHGEREVGDRRLRPVLLRDAVEFQHRLWFVRLGLRVAVSGFRRRLRRDVWVSHCIVPVRG